MVAVDVSGRLGLLVLATVLPNIVAACQRSAREPSLPIVAVSVAPQAYFVDRLAKPWVQVEVMLPPAAHPGTFEPGIRQVLAVNQSRLYLKVGHPNFVFEAAWLDRLLGDSAATVMDSAQGLETLTGDPHIWVAPSAATNLAKRLATLLGALLPEHRQQVQARLTELLADIDRVDQGIAQVVQNAKTRRFYVYHPAWGYLASEYGLTQVAIEQHGKEPAAHEVAALVAKAKKEGTKVVLVQPQFSQQAAQLVADEIGARLLFVDPLARDWLKSMNQVTAALEEALGS